jgi:hypothetical protein
MTVLRHSGAPILLVVAFPGSIHTARWLDLLRHGPFRAVLFPAVIQDGCPELEPARTVSNLKDAHSLRPGEIGVFDAALVKPVAASARERLHSYAPQPTPGSTAQDAASPSSLVGAIEALRPSIVHSLEFQHASYLALEAARKMGEDFPPWAASNWGSDLYLYRKLPEHVPVLRELLQRIDALHSDCVRDFAIAGELGFNGIRFAAVPGAGGADLSAFPDFDALPPPSKRKLILVKGYHGWAGRGLDILLALHRAAPALTGYQIRVTFSSQAVARVVETLTHEDGLDIELDQYYPDHAQALARLAQARLAIGYGISDGISTTLLESMAVGTFCIQSSAACGCEWITPGVTGLNVPPHDIAALADAIVRAATDDALVDGAAALNRETGLRRWDIEKVRPLVLRSYHEILEKVTAQRA